MRRDVSSSSERQRTKFFVASQVAGHGRYDIKDVLIVVCHSVSILLYKQEPKFMFVCSAKLKRAPRSHGALFV
jgi:hypothetical protein